MAVVLAECLGVAIMSSRSAGRFRLSKNEGDEVVAILSDTDQPSNSKDFKGGDVKTVMGGAKLDLRRATITKSATIDILAILGGIEIIVPRDVVVQSQTSTVLGGVEAERLVRHEDAVNPISSLLDARQQRLSLASYEAALFY